MRGLVAVACAVDDPAGTPDVADDPTEQAEEALGLTAALTPSHLCCDTRDCLPASATSVCAGTKFRCTDAGCGVHPATDRLHAQVLRVSRVSGA